MYAKISNSMRFPALLAFVHLLISTWCYVDAFVSISERQTPKFELRSSTQDEPARLRKRDRLLQVLKIQNKPRKEEVKYPIYTESDLEEYWEDKEERFRTSSGEIDHAAMLKSLDVRGDTQQIGSADHKDYVHPVQRLLHERRRGKSVNGTKIALAVEGGGMRGCISAGMVCAIHHLNLTSSFDAVYGSSAGTVVGAYLITGQLPWFGPEVYYDRLTTAGRDFIDTRRLLRAIGFGLLDPRLYKDVLTRPQGKPVLNLSFLFKNTVQETKPLDWDSLVAKSDKLPLYVVASDVKNERSITLNMKDGHFCTLEELANCMLASCLLPGIAGPLMNMNVDSQDSKFLIQNGVEDEGYISMADALIYEPLPYRSALDQGATHVVVLRSRPDGVDVTGKSSLFEKLIFKRFFLKKNSLMNIYRRMRQQLHKKLYAIDILRMNKWADDKSDYKDTSKPHVLAVALPPGSPEVTRLETGREAIFEGMRRGFARAYDCLVEDPEERGRGAIVAKEYFPDEILEYDPLDIDVTDESAYAHYKKTRVTP